MTDTQNEHRRGEYVGFDLPAQVYDAIEQLRTDYKLVVPPVGAFADRYTRAHIMREALGKGLAQMQAEVHEAMEEARTAEAEEQVEAGQ